MWTELWPVCSPRIARRERSLLESFAAPLMLDLARLAAYAHAHGETGTLEHLACFFKDPEGVDVHAFADQFELLRRYVGRALKRESAARSA